MNNHFGMPGPGGSLGECAICGKPFLAEILLGKGVKSFTQDGIRQTLYAHDKCLTQAEAITRWEDLPDGPLRHVFAEHEAKSRQAPVKEPA